MATRKDPFRNFRFRVEIDGIQQAGFSEVTGIESVVEPIDYRTGDEVSRPRKLPGQTKYSALTFKWGITDSKELYEWHRGVIKGQIQRKSISITIIGEDGSSNAARWNVTDAWPSKYHGADLNSKGNELGIETLEVQHEGIERVDP